MSESTDAGTEAEGDAESCGRCAMSSVTGTMEHTEDPYAEGSIELNERSVRAVSPSTWLAGVRDRLDALATRFVHGR